MNKYRVFSVASAIGVSLSVLPSTHVPIVAINSHAVAQESTAQLTSPISPTIAVGFVPPDDDGAPTYSRGGATRNPECDALQVLPENGSGLTSAAHPMVQAYFQSGVEQVWLKIYADDGSEVYTYDDEEYFTLPEGKGFAEIPLPSSLSELALDKRYTWEMALICDGEFNVNSPRVKGGIRRVSFEMPLAGDELMSLQEKMRVYAESGLWYDYISVLTQMKAASPDSVQLVQNWEAALRAVNLDIIFDEFEVAE